MLRTSSAMVIGALRTVYLAPLLISLRRRQSRASRHSAKAVVTGHTAQPRPFFRSTACPMDRQTCSRVRPAACDAGQRPRDRAGVVRWLAAAASLIATILAVCLSVEAPSARGDAPSLRAVLVQLRLMQTRALPARQQQAAHDQDAGLLADAVAEARAASRSAAAARKRAEELAAAVAVQEVDRSLDAHAAAPAMARQAAISGWINGHGRGAVSPLQALDVNASQMPADAINTTEATNAEGGSVAPADANAVGCADPLHCNLNGDGFSWDKIPEPRPDQLPMGASRKTWPNIVNNKRTILFCTTFYKYLGNREKCIRSFTGGPLLD
jgi:hypothetical protein